MTTPGPSNTNLKITVRLSSDATKYVCETKQLVLNFCFGVKRIELDSFSIQFATSNLQLVKRKTQQYEKTILSLFNLAGSLFLHRYTVLFIISIRYLIS